VPKSGAQSRDSVALRRSLTSDLVIEVEARKRDKVVVVELRLQRQVSTSLIEVELVVDVTIIGHDGSKHRRFVEPISRAKGELEVGSSVSIDDRSAYPLGDRAIHESW
jgi:hypothetical protein